MRTCWFDTEAERKHGHFVVSFYMNGHSPWKYTLPLHSRAFLCLKLFGHSKVMYSRGFYRCSISGCFRACLAHSGCCSWNTVCVKIMCSLFLGPCLCVCVCSGACTVLAECVGHTEDSRPPQRASTQQWRLSCFLRAIIRGDSSRWLCKSTQPSLPHTMVPCARLDLCVWIWEICVHVNEIVQLLLRSNMSNEQVNFI